MTRIYSADRIFNGEEWLTGQAVIVNNQQIEDIIPIEQVSKHAIQHFQDCFITPSFIDLQIYGANGKLLASYPEAHALHQLLAHCRKGGTAFCMPTVATNTLSVFHNAIDAVKAYWNEGGQGVLGLHLEGPWINPVKKGAHIASFIHPPSLDEVKDLLDYGKGIIKMITLAPEICSEEILELISSHNIIISAGHSNATYIEAKRSFKRGIRTVTHLFNAMSPLQHRAPGLVGALFDDDTTMGSIIPDGHHVDFAAIRIAKKQMGERLFVITDAVTATTEGYYPHQLAGDKYESGGILSGSALTMIKAVQHLVRDVGIRLEEALRMCSLYPARVISKEMELGKLKKGYQSHLVVISNSLEVKEMI